MKNIANILLEKYNDKTQYELIAENIYKDLTEANDPTVDDNFVTAISFELEENEDSQYPMMDILDEYFLYVADFLEDENANKENSDESYIELGGTLDDIKEMLNSIIGKRVYNKEMVDEDNHVYVDLIIE